MTPKIYIHYGHDKFDPERLKTTRIPGDTFIRAYKPSGLWGSPTDSKLGWKDWCECEQFNINRLNKSFKFCIKPDAKVLEVREVWDVDDYLISTKHTYGNNTWFELTLDTDKIEKDYDAMEVYMNDNYYDLHNSDIFYLWDVDSIVVWNPDVVVPV